MSQPLVSFRGAVTAVRASRGPLGLTLLGTTAAQPPEPTQLAFSDLAGSVPARELADVTVWHAEANRYRLAGAPAAGGIPGEWLFEARAAHLHHDVGAAFYRALPPRPVPWRKRLMWALVLRLAASRAGFALLAWLRPRV